MQISLMLSASTKFSVVFYFRSGLGGKSLEARILEEAEVLCDALSSHAGKPFEMKASLQGCPWDIFICTIPIP